MISPAKLDKLPNDVLYLVEELQGQLISDVCRRVSKANYLTPSAQWQLYKANELRLSAKEINKRIAKQLGRREKAIEELYTDTIKEALKEDADIFRTAAQMGKMPAGTGARIDKYFRSAALSQLLAKGMKNSSGAMRNLCNSLASETNRTLSDAMDLAHLKVISGAYSYNDAIFSAVQELVKKGLTEVTYPSGRRSQVDVCVRRAVLSSVNKACCDVQLDLANELGSRYVEVSSHFGARPSHAEWQGQIYSLKKGDPKYPYFYDATGYGTGDGLGGWNCRHNFFPYFEGIDTPFHTPDFTKEENNAYYALTQKQRAYERAVRDSKRQLAAVDGARNAEGIDPQLKAKLDADFERRAVTLKVREERLDKFIKDNDLPRDNARVRTAGFGKSVSQKAVWAVKKANTPLTSGVKGGTMESELGKFKKFVYANDTITKDYAAVLIDKFSHGRTLGKKAFMKYVPENSVGDFTFLGTPNYNLVSKKISLNYLDDIANGRGPGATWFHEHGHMIDDLAGTLSDDKQFLDILRSDVNAYQMKTIRKFKIQDLAKANEIISGELGDFRTQSAVSDIFSAITHNEVRGCGFHENGYWDGNPLNVTAEPFAHMFEAQFDRQRHAEMKKYFPNALNYFEKKLERAIK